MNFLSHYHFYKSDDLYYNVGLVLPDLARNFCKIHLKPKNDYVIDAHRSLAGGSSAHMEADRIFHQSVFFKACEAYISKKLDGEAQWPRKWFFNHLLLEIGLDRVLMDRHSSLCTSFYEQLEQADIEDITSFLQTSTDADVSSFLTGYERFVSFRFIFDYEHNEKIFLALSRVYSRIGIKYEWTESDRDHLLKNLPGILNFIGDRVPGLESELKINEGY